MILDVKVSNRIPWGINMTGYYYIPAGNIMTRCEGDYLNGGTKRENFRSSRAVLYTADDIIDGHIPFNIIFKLPKEASPFTQLLVGISLVKKFDSQLPYELTFKTIEEVMNGRLIQAIKEIRVGMNIPLKDAKDAMEIIRDAVDPR